MRTWFSVILKHAPTPETLFHPSKPTYNQNIHPISTNRSKDHNTSAMGQPREFESRLHQVNFLTFCVVRVRVFCCVPLHYE
ncbi:hypothetical protein CGRA01v4_01227 [Colletotrichum graminicola]|nr:hypothetical protein CGRA01v4_01227 [Colletotrichum graminicola]